MSRGESRKGGGVGVYQKGWQKSAGDFVFFSFPFVCLGPLRRIWWSVQEQVVTVVQTGGISDQAEFIGGTCTYLGSGERESSFCVRKVTSLRVPTGVQGRANHSPGP